MSVPSAGMEFQPITMATPISYLGDFQTKLMFRKRFPITLSLLGTKELKRTSLLCLSKNLRLSGQMLLG